MSLRMHTHIRIVGHRASPLGTLDSLESEIRTHLQQLDLGSLLIGPGSSFGPVWQIVCQRVAHTLIASPSQHTKPRVIEASSGGRVAKCPSKRRLQ